jgi:hypothetical protein
MSRKEIMESVKKEIENNYKGVFVPCVGLTPSGDYIVIKANGMKERNMPFAAKRILSRHEGIRFVQFTENAYAVEHVYSRETLKWMGI